VIQFHQVKKQYPGNEFVLGEIDLHINEGEFVFLIGPSGSGKTTLIRMLIREEKPTSGKIYFDDRDITNLSRNNIYRLRRQIGVIFQDYKLVPDKNAYENVAFAMEAAGRKDKEIKETVPYVLDIVGLASRAKAFPEQLSGGEKQRVAIARAVANNPRVLIADEPTGNLDPAAAWDIVQILSKINNWGTTVIMSTHGTDIVNSLNKRVVQMEGGRVVRDDSKGMYEMTNHFENQVLKQNGDEVEEPVIEKKGPIKVNMKKVKDQPAAAPKKRKFNLSWFGMGKEEVPEEAEEQFVLEREEVKEYLDDAAEAAQEELQNVEVPEVDSKEADKILNDADRTPVAKLDLRPEIIADLQTAGYNDVEDVISAGPEQLAKELIIDPNEVVLVAKALAKFVEKEEGKKIIKDEGKSETRNQKSETEKEPETQKSEVVEEKTEAPKAEEKSEESKPKSTRVKLNLTSKKKLSKE
jgi:cell division transport system ATP-binding protein